jgi:hypothetical protein
MVFPFPPQRPGKQGAELAQDQFAAAIATYSTLSSSERIAVLLRVFGRAGVDVARFIESRASHASTLTHEGGR